MRDDLPRWPHEAELLSERDGFDAADLDRDLIAQRLQEDVVSILNSCVHAGQTYPVE